MAKENQAWFSRHQNLTKFIQAVRSVIIKNRLQKRLMKLKNITEDDLRTLSEEKSIDLIDRNSGKE